MMAIYNVMGESGLLLCLDENEGDHNITRLHSHPFARGRSSIPFKLNNRSRCLRSRHLLVKAYQPYHVEYPDQQQLTLCTFSEQFGGRKKESLSFSV